MKVESISFQNYRNLADVTLTPCTGVNIIYGNNAQGKTNLLEGLWLFCGGHSFRTQSYRELIQFGKPFAKLGCAFYGQDRRQTAEIVIEPSKRSVKLNGVEKKTSSSLIERFCAVVFSPENLSLIKRGPSERRSFIDSAICRERLRNALTLQKYNRLLKQRNALLKDLQREYSYTIVFITHDLGVVANVADRVAVLYAGQVIELGTVEEVFYDPRHPYTKALLSAVPVPDPLLRSSVFP